MSETKNIDILIPSTGETERTKWVTPKEEVRHKVKMAKIAQAKWSKTSLNERSQGLLQIRDKLKERSLYYATQISKYNGKTIDEALVAEVIPTLGSFTYFAGPAKNILRGKNIFLKNLPFSKSKVHYSPLGILGVISPWNYPFKLALQEVPAALMAGNAVIIKPSEHSAAIGELIEELVMESLIPEDLVQVIYGYGDLGQMLLEEELVQKISFIGSIATGQKVAELAGKKLIRATLELGGKDFALVMPDCDLEKTIRGITWAAFTNSGQTCASIERVLLPKELEEKFIQGIKEYLLELDPSNFGYMNTSFQKEIVQTQLTDALKEGAQEVCRKISDTQQQNKKSFKLSPVLLKGTSSQSNLIKEETFGPLLPLSTYNSIDEALEEINNSPYGLTASIWSENLLEAQEISKKIDTGVVTINDHMITPGFPEAPWSGHKKSGLGYSSSKESLLNLSKMTYTFSDRNLIRYKFWQYPYNTKKRQWTFLFIEALFGTKTSSRLLAYIKTLPFLFFKKE